MNLRAFRPTPIVFAASVVGFLIVPAAAPPLFAQTLAATPVARAAKKPITHDVYDGWRAIQNPTLSRDGTWLVYVLAPQDGDGELVTRSLKTDREWRAPRGVRPQISADGRFVAFAVAPLKADVDKAKKAKKKPDEMPKSGLGLMDLATGAVTTVERVKRFSLPEKGAGRFVAYLMEPASDAKKPDPAEKPAATTPTAPPDDKKDDKSAKKKEPGTDLMLRDLVSSAPPVTLPEVADFAWNKEGTALAFTVSSTAKTPQKDSKDGAFVLPVRVAGERAASLGKPAALLTGLGNYKNLTWDDKGSQIAFVSDRDDYKADTPAFRLYHWSDGEKSAREAAAAATPGMLPGLVVSDSANLRFSKNGARLFFGMARAPKPKPAKDAPEPIAVDIWSWKDAELQTQQKVGADAEKKRGFWAVYHVRDRRVVALGSLDLPVIAFDENGDAPIAVGLSNLAYRPLASWDAGYSDVFLVSLNDNKRTPVLTKQRVTPALSPGGRYLLYWSDADRAWWTVRVRDNKRVCLTAKLAVRFDDEENDSPEPAAPYGAAGWTKDDASVLVYDRYDVWEIRPDDPASAARSVTNGRGRLTQTVFRYQGLDPDERVLPTDKPLLLDAKNDRTKASGFYQTGVPLAAQTVADPRRLLMLDKAFGEPIKAKESDTLVVTESRFDEFPNLWATNAAFADPPRRVSDANPQMAAYRWGKSELIEYANADGKTLRAILTRPDDFDPAKRYPLLVYIYEKLSDGLHRFSAPNPGTSINKARYVSNGYVILEPDIIYTPGYPGESALKCVVPAVQKVLSLGYVDPARVGIQGHSWGGYQIDYLLTRTNLFRCAEAGAAVSDMVSAYGGIRYTTGVSRAFQYERTQSRIGTPPWASPLLYLENSPIFWVDKVTTPYLTIHNDADGAVPWTQGIEFFTALRRLGKEAYLFNFNGEDHGLQQRENQKYWTVHLAEFFDHFLLNAPLPSWMDAPVPYLERGARDLTNVYKPATTPEMAAPVTAPR